MADEVKDVKKGAADVQVREIVKIDRATGERQIVAVKDLTPADKYEIVEGLVRSMYSPPDAAVLGVALSQAALRAAGEPAAMLTLAALAVDGAGIIAHVTGQQPAEADAPSTPADLDKDNLSDEARASLLGALSGVGAGRA